jgi:hypothetical protein
MRLSRIASITSRVLRTPTSCPPSLTKTRCTEPSTMRAAACPIESSGPTVTTLRLIRRDTRRRGRVSSAAWLRLPAWRRPTRIRSVREMTPTAAPDSSSTARLETASPLSRSWTVSR